MEIMRIFAEISNAPIEEKGTAIESKRQKMKTLDKEIKLLDSMIH